jgi:ATP-dependent protease HslVU (ClpYQ) peptidase subunit
MSKKNIILGSILIALTAFAWIWSGPLKDWKQNKGQEKNFLAEVVLAKIDKIIIDNKGQKIELDKSGDAWAISNEKNFAVDKAAAGALNSTLVEIGKLPMETVSAKADKKSSFGTDDQGLKIEIKQPGAIFDFVVGKNTADYSGTYISRVGSGKTYQLALDLNSVFKREDWRDLEIFSFAKERAGKIRFQYPNRQFTVEKINNKWTGTKPNNFTASDDKINAVLTVLQNLAAVKIPAQTFAGTGLEKHNIIVQVFGDGFDNTIMIGDCAKEDLCYAKTAASDIIYLISKSDRDALDKKITDLK